MCASYHKRCHDVMSGFLPDRQTFLQKDILLARLPVVASCDCMIHWSFPKPIFVTLTGRCSDCLRWHELEKDRLVLCVFVMRQRVHDAVGLIVASMIS
jgi:hypothetical protein